MHCLLRCLLLQMLFQWPRKVKTIWVFEDGAWVVLRFKYTPDKDGTEIFSSCSILFACLFIYLFVYWMPEEIVLEQYHTSFVFISLRTCVEILKGLGITAGGETHFKKLWRRHVKLNIRIVWVYIKMSAFIYDISIVRTSTGFELYGRCATSSETNVKYTVI